MEAGVIGHLGLLHIGAVADGIDVAVALHLEILVHSQSTSAGQVTICWAKPTPKPGSIMTIIFNAYSWSQFLKVELLIRDYVYL